MVVLEMERYCSNDYKLVERKLKPIKNCISIFEKYFVRWYGKIQTQKVKQKKRRKIGGRNMKQKTKHREGIL